MTVETLVGYIKEGKKKGFTLEQLHKSLLEQGYSIEEIQNAVIIAENAPTLTEEHGINMGKPLLKKSHNPLVFVIGVVLILILAGALIVLNLDKTSSEETSDEDKTKEDLDILTPEEANEGIENSGELSEIVDFEEESFEPVEDNSEIIGDENETEEGFEENEDSGIIPEEPE